MAEFLEGTCRGSLIRKQCVEEFSGVKTTTKALYMLMATP